MFQYSLTCTEIKPRNDLEDYKNTDNEKRRQHASVFLLLLSCVNISVCDRRYFRKNTMINQSVQISTYTSVHSGRTSSKKNSSVQVKSAPSCHSCHSLAHSLNRSNTFALILLSLQLDLKHYREHSYSAKNGCSNTHTMSLSLYDLLVSSTHQSDSYYLPFGKGVSF